MNLPMGVVLGTFGVERHLVAFTGQAAHSGSTPMDSRRDAFRPGSRSRRCSSARRAGTAACARSARDDANRAS